jgi:hypothetical protein
MKLRKNMEENYQILPHIGHPRILMSNSMSISMRKKMKKASILLKTMRSSSMMELLKQESVEMQAVNAKYFDR